MNCVTGEPLHTHKSIDRNLPDLMTALMFLLFHFQHCCSSVPDYVQTRQGCLVSLCRKKVFNSFWDLVLFMSVYVSNVLLHCFSCNCLLPPHLETNKQKMQKYLEYKVDTSLNVVFFSLTDLHELFCSRVIKRSQVVRLGFMSL